MDLEFPYAMPSTGMNGGYFGFGTNNITQFSWLQSGLKITKGQKMLSLLKGPFVYIRMSVLLDPETNSKFSRMLLHIEIYICIAVISKV